MKAKELRELISKRPFRPIIFHLEDGGNRLISRPTLVITNYIVVAIDEKGEAVYMTPEAISSITYQKRSKLSARGR